MTQAMPASFRISAGADGSRATKDATSLAGIRIAIHDQLSSIERDWRAFEQNAELTVFQTFDWLATWYRHVGQRVGAKPVIVTGRDSRNAMLFLLPFCIRRTGLTRRLEWLGSELSDYNAPLLARDFEQRVGAGRLAPLARHVIQRLRDDPAARHSVAVLEKMPEFVGDQPNFLLRLRATRNPSGAHLATLSGTWPEFYEAKRSPTTRRRDRTKLARISELGAVRLVDVESQEERSATLAILLGQKQRLLAAMGVANFFDRPGYREFFAALATEDSIRPLTHLSRLDVGTLPAAANLGLVHRGRYYYLLSSYDGGEILRFGPGAVHLRELMRRAIEHGYTCFDFSIGDEPYKRDWCDIHIDLFDHISAASGLGTLSVAREMTLRRLKRQIKQTPLFWRAFSRTRAFAGSLRRRFS